VDLKAVMLSEISQRKINALSLHLHVESKKHTKQRTEKNPDSKIKQRPTQ